MTIAEIGTPSSLSAFSSRQGQFTKGAVKRLFGWAAGVGLSGVQSLPCQSFRCAGGSLVIPSHHTSPSSVRATFVKMEFFEHEIIAFGFVFMLVPGATPKKPFSGLMA